MHTVCSHDCPDSCGVLVTVNVSLPAGVAAGQLDWAKVSPGGGNVNALTSERLTDIGAGTTFYSVLVEVARAYGIFTMLQCGHRALPP